MIDWTACELIRERLPARSPGSPSCTDAHQPDRHCEQLRLGDSIDDIHEGFPTLSVAQIKRLIGVRQRPAPAAAP